MKRIDVFPTTDRQSTYINLSFNEITKKTEQHNTNCFYCSNICVSSFMVIHYKKTLPKDEHGNLFSPSIHAANSILSNSDTSPS